MELAKVPKAPADAQSWAGLFQPDILAPARYYNRMLRTRQAEPEKMLMAAVLEDAIYNYQRGMCATDTRAKARFREAEDWLFQEQSIWLFSFEKICEALDLDPNYIRMGLVRWRRTALNRRIKVRLFYIVSAGRRRRRKHRFQRQETGGLGRRRKGIQFNQSFGG